MKTINIFLFIISLFGIIGCNKDTAIPKDNTSSDSLYSITFIESSLLNIAEPSGLSWDFDKTNFLVVDDNTNKVYKIDKRGNTIDTLLYLGDDTEGITIDANNNKIWIAEERLSKIIKINTIGVQLQSFDIETNRVYDNKGLEGLSYNSYNNTFYILNENEPGLLIKWEEANGIISKTELKFAEDYSGIYADNTDQNLWIISDQSRKLFYCDKSGKVIQSYSLDYGKAEGLVVDIKNQRLYIVSDSEHRLYTYKITKQ